MTFHAQGTFSKVYTIETEAATSIMCVVIPVVRNGKTAGAVATMEFNRSKAIAPVPRVLAQTHRTTML